MQQFDRMIREGTPEEKALLMFFGSVHTGVHSKNVDEIFASLGAAITMLANAKYPSDDQPEPTDEEQAEAFRQASVDIIEAETAASTAEARLGA